MDWNNVVTILGILIFIKWSAGAIYGIWMMRTTSPLTWNWQTDLAVGPVFWIGWGVGTGLRRLVEWRRKARTQ